MVQERLTRMLAELTTMQLTCRHLADLDQAGTLTPTQASLAKYTQHPRAPGGSPPSPGTCSAATASCWRTA